MIREQLQYHGALALRQDSQQGADLRVRFGNDDQVVAVGAQGLSNYEIGEKLNLSHKTIARHRERIMNKLNMHSRTELVKFAIRTGLISLE